MQPLSEQAKRPPNEFSTHHARSNSDSSMNTSRRRNGSGVCRSAIGQKYSRGSLNHDLSRNLASPSTHAGGGISLRRENSSTIAAKYASNLGSTVNGGSSTTIRRRPSMSAALKSSTKSRIGMNGSSPSRIALATSLPVSATSCGLYSKAVSTVPLRLATTRGCHRRLIERTTTTASAATVHAPRVIANAGGASCRTRRRGRRSRGPLPRREQAVVAIQVSRRSGPREDRAEERRIPPRCRPR